MKLLAALLMLLIVSACVEQRSLPPPAVVVAPPAEPIEPVPAPPPRTEDRVAQLLRAAEAALAANRLTLPRHENAYDLFRQVLQLQPDNVQARAGIDDIVVRYVHLARDAIAHSRWQEAQLLISRAAAVKPNNPLLAEVTNDLQRARALSQQEQQATTRILLNEADLNSKSEALLKLLGELAARISASDESVLIVARNDSEGRWLYKQLNLAAGGYRVRGDIKIGAPPSIAVLPPI
ncbi:N-acetylglucosaminyltransferase [Pseudomaricurvus alcaniphilus]|uniref:N-acetylglucosaminyltransferase n=1 Tax=Pseudomaricurvus alcaniphilus TaxID=1166482 RepID=UPI001409CB9A|nr:N-acetylglucosaminyltransferase [Pseudomaricurvus alcaniphilus]NHN38907.1 N-acetylglucosaminyltransferase [Pseudomaricurvus alcaniphilus]